MMSMLEFLAELSATGDRFDWGLQVDGSTQLEERRSSSRLRLRGTLRDSSPPLVLDPLRAVYFAKTGKVVGSALCMVADALGVSDQRASMILAATNDRTWSGFGDERVPVDGLQSIRERLLEAVGVSEDDVPSEAAESVSSAS